MHLEKRLVRDHRGINLLYACREHDIAYSYSRSRKRYAADNILAKKARKRITARDSIFREKAAATAVWLAMKAKTMIDMGTKKKKKKSKRIHLMAKRDGVLFVQPLLGILGSLVGGSKVVNDNKAAQL